MPLETDKGFLPSDVWFLAVTVTESMGLGGKEEMESRRILLPRSKNKTTTAALVMPCQLREILHVEACTVQSCEG